MSSLDDIGWGGYFEALFLDAASRVEGKVIVEDGAFIGSRSILVEGVVVEEGAVLGANTVITAGNYVVIGRNDRQAASKCLENDLAKRKFLTLAVDTRPDF